MMASETAKRLNLPTRACWLDLRTHRNLKDLCAATIIASWSCDTPLRWQNLSERHLEMRFGRIRTSFSNCCMTASDFWRASATVMRRELHAFEKNMPDQVPMEKPLTANQFCTIAQRSLQASLKFAAICSGRSPADLQSAFNLSQAGAEFEASMAEEECRGEGEVNEEKGSKKKGFRIIMNHSDVFNRCWFLKSVVRNPAILNANRCVV